MLYQPTFSPNSRDARISPIPDVTDTAAGLMTPEQKAKLDSLPVGGMLAGNVVGPATNNTVVRVQDIPLDLAGHAANQVLALDPSNTKIVPSDVLLNGNVTGTAGANSVVKIQDIPLDLAGHAAGQVLALDSTNTKIVPANSSSSSGKLTRIYYVDPNGPGSGADGGIRAPFQTIQAAINQARADTPISSVGVQYENVLLVSPTKYDEDLVIDGTSMHLAILGNGGPWMLGQYAAGSPNFAPTNARNIVWNLNANNIDLVRHSLRLGVFGDPHDGTVTHIGYNTTPRISGVVTVSDNVLGGTTKELYMSAIIEDFAATGTCLQQVGLGAPTGVLMLYSDRSRYKSAVSGTQLRVQRSRFDQFDGLVTANRWSQAVSSSILAGWTLASASADVTPNGCYVCNMAGTFTGPALSVRLDGSSNYWFKTNGAALAGGATKVILDDLIP